VFFAELEWLRPWGFVALALPLFVLYITRRPGRPLTVPVGSFEIWRSLGQPKRAQGARRQRRIPLDRWLLIIGLTLGAFALAGPEKARAEEESQLHVLVDRSPSMYLPHASGGTRLEQALERADEFLDGDVLWLAPSRSGLERSAGRFPGAWLLPPTVARPDLDTSAFDLAGHLWLTDRTPEVLPRRAGLVASGGAAVHGPVASVGSTRFDWDGGELREIAGGVQAPYIVLDGAWPQLVRQFVTEVWAPERGARVAASARPGCALELRAVTSAGDAEFAAARDGWSAGVRASVDGAPLHADGRALEEWLGANDGRGRVVLLSAGPGLIVSALTDFAEPSGDPAAFAVSWSRLLDEHLLPADGVIALAERVAAGDEHISAPQEVPPTRPGEPAGISAWLAGAAALFAALSFGVRLA